MAEPQVRHGYDTLSRLASHCRTQQRSTGLQTRGIVRNRIFFAIPRSPRFPDPQQEPIYANDLYRYDSEIPSDDRCRYRG